MFKSMRLKNFKGYKDSGEVPLAPLAVIVGANNSGKSTLFHALLALAQTSRDRDQGWAPRLVTKGLVDLNGFQDLVHGRDDAKSSSVEISVVLDSKAARPRTLVHGHMHNGVEFPIPDRAEISFGWNDEINEILLNRSTLRIDQDAVISVESKLHGWSFIKVPADAPPSAGVDFIGVFPSIEISLNPLPSLEFLAAQRKADFAAELWHEVFKRQVKHIGPMRVRVPWNASEGARASSEFGLGGENLIADLGSKEKDSVTEKTRLELVNEWLRKKGILKQVRLVELSKGGGVRVLLGDDCGGPANINVAAMGEGVSQILPIIAYSRFGANEDCLLIEQPEIHLHPALQADLGDLCIDIVQTEHRQILVETHSEHFLLRVRRRIAEGTLDPDQVAILFVEKHGGESKVRKLDLNDRGHFTDWPKGFFDEAYQDAMALATAASKKG